MVLINIITSAADTNGSGLRFKFLKPIALFGLLLILCFSSIPHASSYEHQLTDKHITLGIFAFRPKEILAQQYQPLADYLTEALGDTQVVIEVLTQDEIEDAILNQRLDLLFTNPSHYVQVRSRSPLSGALATLISKEDGQAVDHLGGVIISRYDNPDANELRQLRGSRIGVPGTRFLGGFQTQSYELRQVGVRLPDHAELIELGGHDGVVFAVLAGDVEYGFIRTGIIEAMEREGKIDPTELKIINPQQHPHFPYRVSTRLYPEWAFVSLPHLDRRNVRLIASALMALEETHPAAISASIGGFSPPGDYLPVENLARALRMPPFDERIPLEVFWYDHRQLAVTSIVLLSILTLWALWVSGRMLQQRRKADALTRQAASVFEHANEGIIITDPQGKILDINTAFTNITGYSREDVIGKNPRMLRSNYHNQEFYQEMWKALEQTGLWRGELWNRHKNGQIYAELLNISTIRKPNGDVVRYIGIFSDITQLKHQQKQLEFMAHYDALTGLPNRVLLADRLQQAMAQAQRRKNKVAVVFLDLDGFKNINDSHDHEFGDLLLIQVANKMKSVMRDGDTLARFGGDEFVAVLLDFPNLASSIPVLERLLHTCAEPVTIKDRQISITASIGVSYFPQEEELDADQLIRQADQAMYQAKQTGKNHYHIFDTEQDSAVRGQYESIERIREALCNNEFVLYYQPKVNMRTGEVLGVEALIRWQHPERGLLPPAAFLPILEHHPLAISLGEWVLSTALNQLDEWRNQGLKLSISVNIHALHLQQADFIDRLIAEIKRHDQFAAGELELEILETSALENIAGVSKIIQACQKIGVDFSVDDFGTGYSSLTYLKRLPAQMLKIDQSFVRDMLEDPDDLAILDGIIGLAKAFNRKVIAEGVETFEHCEMLLRLGCELGQGYAIGKPMPALMIEEWVQTWKPAETLNSIQPVDHRDLPILFAIVEHLAWTKELEHFLRGQLLMPPLIRKDECRFGPWLSQHSPSSRINSAIFDKIDKTHHSLHQHAIDLITLKSNDQQDAAIQGIEELHKKRVLLQQQLEQLLKEKNL
ncbi:MAG: EAL domain-containing protein [Oceanospirillales bacterium]|nr:MAG: EAL domain-containing protein [Oceanospirillales bacterium]